MLQELLTIALLRRFAISFQTVAAFAGEVFARVKVLEEAADGIKAVIGKCDLACLRNLSLAVEYIDTLSTYRCICS